ncbi:MAG: hypothetical protein SFV22_11175 [Saprospiraceae bacterium]|nr:hypothetical protein [Saprospiraceae bacterium]
MRTLVYSFVLLAVLLAPVLGGFGCLHYQKKLVRREWKQKLLACLPEDQLVQLMFNQRDARNLLKWEHAREFEYLGRMYDVVRVEQNGDRMIYHCWADHAETAINQQLHTLLANALQTDPAGRQSKEQMSVFFRTLFFQDSPCWSLPCIDPAEKMAFPAHFYPLAHGDSSPPSPPPERV